MSHCAGGKYITVAFDVKHMSDTDRSAEKRTNGMGGPRKL